jgi:large subunit ribosomal protein L25
VYNTATMLQVTTLPRAPKETVKEGFTPSVFYGRHTKSTPIFINTIEFKKALASAGESSSILLKTETGTETAMIQDVQVHPVKGDVVHADFYIIEKGQKVDVMTPIIFVGESQAVKEGGILVKVLHELSIEGEPALLPHEFTVDISSLTTMDSVIQVKDIKLPAGVELYDVGEDDIVASIAEAEEEDVTPAAPVDLSTIEVEEKGKKEVEGEAAEGEVKEKAA